MRKVIFYCKILQTPTFTHKMQKAGNEIWGHLNTIIHSCFSLHPEDQGSQKYFNQLPN